jgi:flagellar hook-associated protein 2
MSSNPLSLSGLGSGLDTRSLVAQLMNLERQPLMQLQQRKQLLVDRNTAFQGVNTKLQALQSAASDLRLSANIGAKLATTTNSSIVTGTASSSAALGSYRIRVDQLATATNVTTNTAIGAPVTNPTQLLSSLNTSSPVSTGNFTIQYTNGGTVTNASVNITAGMSLNDAFNAISTATSGTVTAALGTGANANKLVLSTAAGTTNLVVGSSSDTSNFASVMNLRTATFNAGTGTMTSSSGIGVTNVNVGIGSSNASGLSTAITTNGAGSFQINGVTINYNTGTDSIKNVLDRINTSSAGVVASYNSSNDKISITSRTTGSNAITMSDTTGNFLSAVGLTDPARQLITNGQNALIGIEGVNGFTSATGAADFTRDVSSTSNNFANVIAGVTFNAQNVSSGNSRETVTVGTDTATIGGKVKAFVDAYNAAVDSINGTTGKGQVNAFDNDLLGIRDHLASILTTRVSSTSGGPQSLADLGISTTSTDRVHLSFDQNKFNAQLAANPDAVAAVFQTSTTGVAQQFNTYLTNVSGASGVFATRNASLQRQTRDYDNQISNTNRVLTQRQQLLQRQFSTMDKMVSQLHSQQNAFLSQLGSLG